MSVRINLLKESEKRRVGLASSAAILRFACFGTVAVLLCIVVVAASGRVVVNADLSRMQAKWDDDEALFVELTQLQDELGEKQELVKELDAWRGANIRWSEPFRALVSMVPDMIQLTRINVLGSILSSDKPAKGGSSKELVRCSDMTIDGRIDGEKGDEVVVKFVERVGQSASFGRLLETIRLRDLQMDRQRVMTTNVVRRFSVVGVFSERALQ